MSDDSAPGMDAIHAAMIALHGPQEPVHWLLDSSLGLLGSHLESASAYDAGDHWHLVTLGLSEIWEKQGPDPAVSGLGYEFTMRVRKPPPSRWGLGRGRTSAPPSWAVHFLQRLGDVTLEGARFRPGETLDPGGPITGDPSDVLTAVGFVDDPGLPHLDTPNGRVAFVQVFGLTAEQLQLVRRGESALRSFAGRDGLFVTDTTTRRWPPGRRSTAPRFWAPRARESPDDWRSSAPKKIGNRSRAPVSTHCCRSAELTGAQNIGRRPGQKVSMAWFRVALGRMTAEVFEAIGA